MCVPVRVRRTKTGRLSANSRPFHARNNLMDMIDCDNRTFQDDVPVCTLIATLSGMPLNKCVVPEDACRACIAAEHHPRGLNHVTASKVLSLARQHAPESVPDLQRRFVKYLHRGDPRGRPVIERFPCVHRGGVSRTFPCKACNGRRDDAVVYFCRKHGECTVDARAATAADGKPLTICYDCDDIRAVAGEPVTLRVGWSPGDNIAASAAVFEIAKAYPGRFDITIRTHFPQIWENNPGIAGTEDAKNDDDGKPGWLNLNCEKLLNQSWHRPVHYIEAFILDLRERLGLADLEITEFRGHVYLSDDEKSHNQVEQITGNPTRPIWLVNAGHKQDSTCKVWPIEYYQAVVDHFADAGKKVRFVQVGAFEDDSGGHVHPALEGVVDLRGKTDHAQLRSLVWHADGVLCGNTYLMHLAAAVDDPPWRPWRRPCVVIGGGRESVAWYNYPAHTALHSIGAYECCAWSGCWKDRVVPLGDGRDLYDSESKLCRLPVGQHAKCMVEITPEDAIRVIERYRLVVGADGQGPSKNFP